MVKIIAKKDCTCGGYSRGDVLDAASRNEKEYSFIDNEGNWRHRLKKEFDIAEEQSPVRTVTRKEIVPGVYGKVNVSLYQDGRPCVAVYFPKDANELREAAHILNQIAEALEDGTTF